MIFQIFINVFDVFQLSYIVLWKFWENLKKSLVHLTSFLKTHFSSTGHFQKPQKSTTRSITNWDFGNVLGHEDSRKERESCVWNVLCFLHNTARWQKFLKISHFTQEELRRSRNSIKKRFPHLFVIFFKKKPATSDTFL